MGTNMLEEIWSMHKTLFAFAITAYMHASFEVGGSMLFQFSCKVETFITVRALVSGWLMAVFMTRKC